MKYHVLFGTLTTTISTLVNTKLNTCRINKLKYCTTLLCTKNYSFTTTEGTTGTTGGVPALLFFCDLLFALTPAG